MLFYPFFDLLSIVLFSLVFLYSLCTAMVLVSLETISYKYGKKIFGKSLKLHRYFSKKTDRLSDPIDIFPKILLNEYIQKIYLYITPSYFLDMDDEYQTYDMCKFVLLQDPGILQFLPQHLLNNKTYKFVLKKKLIDKEPELVLHIPQEMRTLEMYLACIKEYGDIHDLPKHMQTEAIYSQIFKNTPDILDKYPDYFYYRTDITYEEFMLTLNEIINLDEDLFNYVFRYSSVTKYMKSRFYKLMPFKYQIHKRDYVNSLLFIKN